MQLSSIISSAKSSSPARLQTHELESIADYCLNWLERITWVDPFETGKLDTDLFLEHVCVEAGYQLEYLEAPAWREKERRTFAMTEPLRKKVYVALCGDIDERSRRHAMAHEAFHVFHDHDFFMRYQNIPEALEAAKQILDYNANDFARIIHLPGGLMLKGFQKTRAQGHSILSAVEIFSRVFGISTMSVKIRLKELNLVTPEEVGL